MPGFMRRWTYGSKLETAKAAAINIGNAHQYIQLGDIHLQMANRTGALQAYQTALDKDAKSVNALWGASQVHFLNQAWEQARPLLEQLLTLEPEARFGEASLMYAKVLYELKEWQALKPHLEKDFRSWSHPESGVMLATLLNQEGNGGEARKLLETMIARMQASPTYHQRKHQGSLRQARQLLRHLSA
jgi:tetratricopeptide (TPR) repeat protein